MDTDINNPPAPSEQAPEIVLSRSHMLDELLKFCNDFRQKSEEWRKNSFETQWQRWQRNSDSVYDPGLLDKKESWQSAVVWPITASHRENAHAQLFKTEVGPRPPLEVQSRPGMVPPEMDQGANIRDLILREREKCRYEVERNKVLEDKTTYGSGFAHIYWCQKIEPRLFKVPQYEEVSLSDFGSLARAAYGQRRVVGYADEMRDAIIYRGIKFRHISIWDVFPDPRAIDVKGHPIAVRYQQTFQEVLQMVKDGYYIEECVAKLQGEDSDEMTPEGKRNVESDRGIADSDVPRPKYGKLLTCYELYARLPQKWVLINGESIDDPEKLIPAIVRFHDKTVVMVRVNDSYDGEPLIYKDDYMPVSGQFYGRGIPEMLKDVQDVSTETVCQRLDNGAISLNTMFAVIEKYIADPKDFKAGPGNVLKLKLPPGVNTIDVRQVLQKLDMGMMDRASFIEPQEWERAAQERTSINRVTMGTAGQVKDANETLGGMEMLRQASGDKLAFIGMLSEFAFQYDLFRAFWKLIYANYDQQDIVKALGPQRAQTVLLLSPVQIEENYSYIPQGTFTMENKAMRQARLSNIRRQYAGAPWLNDMAFFDKQLQSVDEDPQQFKIPEAEAMQIMAKAQQIADQRVMAAIDQKNEEKKLKAAIPEAKEVGAEGKDAD
jgi:hypothetical protein